MPFHVRSFGKRPPGILKHMSSDEFALFSQTDTIPEIRIFFSGKSDDNVCRNAVKRIEFTKDIDNLEIFTAIIRSVHSVQNPVAAALCA